METLQVRYAGTGGQGVILLGVLTADAAVRAGNYATQGSYYGAQVRGGITSADVVLSKDWVAFPYVEYSDILLALTSESLSYYLKFAREGSIVIVDEIVLIEEDQGELISKFKFERVPFTRLCYEKFNSGFLLNIVAFGYVLRYLRGFFSEEEALAALKENVPEKYYEMEAEAFRLGTSI